MKYAIIQISGKQHKVVEGDLIPVERQSEPLRLDVLLYKNGESVLVGNPILSSVFVSAEINEEFRSDKVRVARFKSKSRYRKEKGHRQPMQMLKIISITEKKAKSEAGKPIIAESKIKEPVNKNVEKENKVAKTDTKDTKSKKLTKKSN